jgi:Skp family chaperone for outer membrane proteins
MTRLKKLILLQFFFITFFSIMVKSVENLYYVDFDFILNNSLSGKSLILELNDLKKKNDTKFKKKSDKIKLDKEIIIKQKNVINNTEFELKINNLNKEIDIYKKELNKDLALIESLRIKANAQLIKIVNDILIEYSDKNGIDLIINKKSVIIGKSDLEITSEIIKILNDKIKKINL